MLYTFCACLCSQDVISSSNKDQLYRVSRQDFIPKPIFNSMETAIQNYDFK